MLLAWNIHLLQAIIIKTCSFDNYIPDKLFIESAANSTGFTQLVLVFLVKFVPL